MRPFRLGTRGRVRVGRERHRTRRHTCTKVCAVCAERQCRGQMVELFRHAKAKSHDGGLGLKHQDAASDATGGGLREVLDRPQLVAARHAVPTDDVPNSGLTLRWTSARRFTFRMPSRLPPLSRRLLRRHRRFPAGAAGRSVATRWGGIPPTTVTACPDRTAERTLDSDVGEVSGADHRPPVRGRAARGAYASRSRGRRSAQAVPRRCCRLCRRRH